MKRAILIAVMILAVGITAFAEDKKFPKLDDGQVIMKWADFEKILRELLKPDPVDPEPEPEPPPPPPVDYSFSSASFDVTIGKGFAEIEAEYVLDVLVEKKWISLPLGQRNSGIHKVMLDGKPALLSNRSGSIVILLMGKKSHHLNVSYTVTAPQNPGPNSFSVPVVSVPGAVINLNAPAELSEITISGAVMTDSSKSKDKQMIRAITGATQALDIGYTVPVPEALAAETEKLPAKLYSSVKMLVSIADEVTSAHAYFNYDIKHSPLSRFSVAVPEGYDVVSVIGQGVSGWKVDEGTLLVSVNYEVKGGYLLRVHMETKRKKASGALIIPEPKTVDAERESGFVAVETRSSLEVSVDELAGLMPIDATELPASLRQRAKYPILFAFRFGQHPYAGTLSVTRHEEVEVLTAAIDIVNLVTLFTEDGKALTRMIYEIRNNKKQYLKIDLPEKAEVWSAFLDNEPVKPSINGKGQTLLPLKKSGADGKKVSFTVEVIYFAPIDDMKKSGKLNIGFPKADIPASEMLLSLYLPPKFNYKKFEGDLEETPEEPVSVGYIADTTTETKHVAPGVAGKKKDKNVRYSKRALMRQNEMEKEIADEIQVQQKQELTMLGLNDMDQGVVSQEKPRRRGGMLPVKFNVPLRGTVKRFSKLLVMDEAPELTFNYRKKWKPIPWQKVRLAVKIILGIIVAFVLIILILRLRLRFQRKETETHVEEEPDSAVE